MTMNRVTCSLLALAMMPSLCAAGGWREVKLTDDGISVVLLGETNLTTGLLRSMPQDMTGPIAWSIVGTGKYHVAVSDLPRKVSLRTLARTFAQNEVTYQETWPKKSENIYLRSARFFVKPSKLKTLKFNGRDAIEFSIDIDVRIPSAGFGTRDLVVRFGREKVRLIRVDDTIIVMVWEQFQDPFHSDRTVQRFFKGLNVPGKDTVTTSHLRRLTTQGNLERKEKQVR